MSDKWSRSAELVNQRGLHARASAAFAREAAKFNARVSVKHDGMVAEAAGPAHIVEHHHKRFTLPGQFIE